MSQFIHFMCYLQWEREFTLNKMCCSFQMNFEMQMAKTSSALCNLFTLPVYVGEKGNSFGSLAPKVSTKPILINEL